ncbi:MAG: hypothetical protein JXR75_01085, partial [Rhodobacteraceae bacterium]|nr:hypothetical protein [Paracoccaceae bacterium]
MDGSKRYSQKRLEDSFTIYVLLSEPLQFTVSETLSALREDYPGLLWSGDILSGAVIDTASFGVGVLWPQESEQRKPSPVNFIATPGRCDVNRADILHKSRFVFPEGKAAVDRHVSCLSISVKSHDTSLPARFDAARRMTCIGAIFARLPICTAIYYPGADMVLPPKFWTAAADTASRDGVPVLQWINFTPVALPDEKQPTPMTTSSIGL